MDGESPLDAARRLLRGGKDLPEWLKPPVGHKVGVPTTQSAGSWVFEVAEVDLVGDVQPVLAKAFEVLRHPESDDGEEALCKVWVDTRDASSTGPLQVILGSQLIGTLDGEDALALQRDLQEAQKRERPLILEASIERERGRFSLWVVVPPTE